MASVGDKIVTLTSLKQASSKTGAQESEAPRAMASQLPEMQLREARYQQIMERLEIESEEIGPELMVAVPDREVSLAQSKIAQDAADAQTKPMPSGGQEVQFGDGIRGFDWFRWIWSLTDHVDRANAHAIVRPADAVAATIPNNAIVAMAGDWGTNLYGAPKIAASIQRMAAQRKFDLALHLGDVYYSGTIDETKERFLNVWPASAATLNRAVNANHEMYSGGFGYFDLILPAFDQKSSYFALKNDDWVLVGLDTAYVDHDMDNAQVAWLKLAIDTARRERNSRKIALFSHQQPFSRLSSQGPKLQAALKRFLEDRMITAWYWGHEHQCVIYDQHSTWGLFGRCLGNGGIPTPRHSDVKNAPADPKFPGAASCTWRRLAAVNDVPGCIVLDGPNMDLKKSGDQQKFLPHGFMTIEFKGATIEEKVYLANGTELYSNVIQ